MKYIVAVCGISLVGLLVLGKNYYSKNSESENNELGEVSSLGLSDSNSIAAANNVTGYEDTNSPSIDGEDSVSAKLDTAPDVIVDDFNEPMSDEALNKAFNKYMNDKSLIEESLVQSGFSQEAGEAFASDDAKALIHVMDLPEEIRQDILSDLKLREEEGYVVAPELEAEEITGIMNYIAGTDVASANVEFELSNVPEIVSESYEYIGYTYPNYSENTDMSQVENNTIRRVFSSHTSTDYVIIEESPNVAGARAVQIAEYINTEVGDQPAILHDHLSESGKEFTSLNWTDETHAFTLYKVGDSGQHQNQLMSLATVISNRDK